MEVNDTAAAITHTIAKTRPLSTLQRREWKIITSSKLIGISQPRDAHGQLLVVSTSIELHEMIIEARRGRKRSCCYSSISSMNVIVTTLAANLVAKMKGINRHMAVLKWIAVLALLASVTHATAPVTPSIAVGNKFPATDTLACGEESSA